MHLIGTWEVDDTDEHALAELGDVVLAFEEGGALTYTIRCRDKDQIIKLRYQIAGATIVTDQPSIPRVEHTEFSISEDGILTLAFDGVPCRFKRRL